jgi:hypothetical protein
MIDCTNGSSDTFEQAVNSALHQMMYVESRTGCSRWLKGSRELDGEIIIPKIAGQARSRTPYGTASHNSCAGKGLSTSVDMTKPWVDTTPSNSYVKNPITMGIFTSEGQVSTHASGIGNWKPPSKRERLFSLPPRFDWSSQYSVFRTGSRRAFIARCRWVSAGGKEITQ